MRSASATASPTRSTSHDFKCAPFLTRRAQSERHRHPGRVAHWQDAVGTLAHFNHPLIISQMDDLQKISAHTDGSVFIRCASRIQDHQMRFRTIRCASGNLRTICLRKMSSKVTWATRSKGARYRHARIPAGMQRLLTISCDSTSGGSVRWRLRWSWMACRALAVYNDRQLNTLGFQS